MALQGNLDDFSLPEILQLIAVQQKSGVLKLTAGDDLAVIFFDGGKVVSTRDRRRNAKDPLKPFLLKTGRLTEPQLRQVETIEAESRRELTDILLSGNYMTSDQLGKALEDQVQDTLHQLLTWKTGTYHFSGDSRTVPKFAVNIRLNTEGLLMESMRRIDELTRYKEVLTSPAMVLRPKALASPPKEMTEAERRVLPLVDGLRPLRDVIAQSKLVEFEVYEALHHFYDLGVVEISLSAAPKITPMPTATPARAGTGGGAVRGGLALALGLAVLAISIALGFYGAPALLQPVEKAAVGTPWAPPEIADLDDASRMDIATQTYRTLRGKSPANTETLVREGFLPASMLRKAQEKPATKRRTKR
ncbi:MAG TPA: DUF4388 domain-containing protein [Candidatus Eisenbacteria bacterium]|nr:DUF4388 domain-containing protein [Candidatus Eisenbacteria bacterium]